MGSKHSCGCVSLSVNFQAIIASVYSVLSYNSFLLLIVDKRSSVVPHIRMRLSSALATSTTINLTLLV